tara:strand:- start:98 stop:622 length:525 start_codon:yes stop_codon:yes gene_type:complete
MNNKIFDHSLIKTRKYSKKLENKFFKDFIKSIDDLEFLFLKNKKHYFWQNLKKNRISLYLFYFEKEIIGCLAVITYKGINHIYGIYVSKKYRSQKIGNFILEYLYNHFKNKIKTNHIIKSLKTSDKILNFFLKNGWSIYNKKKNIEQVDQWIDKNNKYKKNYYHEKILLYYKVN